MGLPRNRRIHQTLFIVFQILLVSLFGSIPVIGSNVAKKLDQELVPNNQMPDETSMKCGTCPCVNPCCQLPPPPPCPPPPPPPCPPPPPPPCPTCCPPQVPVQTPPPCLTCCPPQVPVQTPPPPRFVYMTGEPGGIYHTEANDWGFYSTAQRNVAKKLLLLAGLCGVLLGLLIIR